MKCLAAAGCVNDLAAPLTFTPPPVVQEGRKEVREDGKERKGGREGE